MSERSFVASCLVRLGYSHDKAESIVQGALDEHAHELAEKIREASACYRGSNDCGDPDCVGRMAAADLIDPEPDRE